METTAERNKTVVKFLELISDAMVITGPVLVSMYLSALMSAPDVGFTFDWFVMVLAVTISIVTALMLAFVRWL